MSVARKVLEEKEKRKCSKCGSDLIKLIISENEWIIICPECDKP